MSRSERYRTKMLRGLVRALDDEAAHVRRFSRVSNACAVLGGLILALASMAAWGAGDGAMWLVMSGAAAGLLIGLAVFFASAVEQWPVTREFLDVQAVRQAARLADR